MPVISGEDSKGKYYKVENVDTKYYVSEHGEDEAKRLAHVQEYAIEKNENEKVVINTKTGYIELCDDVETNQAMSGRTRIKMVAHEIYDSELNFNKNGISWQEPYITQNLKSAIGMPYIVQFYDSDKTIPIGHGTMEYDDDGNVMFKDSETVGSVQNAYIGKVNIDGIEKNAMITEGYLYNQRYPNFVKWLKEQSSNGDKIKGSIEINGKADSKIIEYINGKYDQNGNLKNGRVPSVYDYSGMAILYLEEPSDDTAEMIEINNKNDKEGVKNMEFKEMYEEQVEKNSKLETELNGAKAKQSELEEIVVNANKDLEAIKSEKEVLETELNALKAEKEVVETELNTFKEAELKATVKKYFDEEVSKNGFAKEDMAELNSFVEKSDLVGLKDKEKELALKKIKEQAETNSKKEDKEEAEVNSIMFSTDSEEASDKTELNMFNI